VQKLDVLTLDFIKSNSEHPLEPCYDYTVQAWCPPWCGIFVCPDYENISEKSHRHHFLCETFVMSENTKMRHISQIYSLECGKRAALC